MHTRRRAATSFTVSEAEKSGSKGEAKSLRNDASGGVSWNGASSADRVVTRACEALLTPAIPLSYFPS